MVVDNATVLANYFAISELTMGLTAIAIGTSLPELATAIAGVRKGENDIAVGNIIGANILSRLQRCAALDKYSGTVAPLASITMGQNRIDQTVFHRFRGGKEAIALGITFNLF